MTLAEKLALRRSELSNAQFSADVVKTTVDNSLIENHSILTPYEALKLKINTKVTDKNLNVANEVKQGFNTPLKTVISNSPVLPINPSSLSLKDRLALRAKEAQSVAHVDSNPFTSSNTSNTSNSNPLSITTTITTNTNTNTNTNTSNDNETPYDFKDSSILEAELKQQKYNQRLAELNAEFGISTVSEIKKEVLQIKEDNVLVPVLYIDKEADVSNNDVVKTYPDAKLGTNIALSIKESFADRIKRQREENNKGVSLDSKPVSTVLLTSESIVDKEDNTYPITVESLVGKEVKRNTNDVEYANSFTNKATFSLDIVLNEKQQSAVDFIKTNQSYVLLGAAGTGKTSSERAMLTTLLEADVLKYSSFKVSGEIRIDAPSVAVVAYTRRAAANSAKAILKDPALALTLSHNIMTIHALLEFIPVEYYDAEKQKDVFRFEPQRDAKNPLTLTHLFIEEATLVGLDLWEQLYDALPSGCVIVYIGDINQLPPVFGASILNYAITRLPVIELTHVYRQGAGSPIINNAHKILKGEFLASESNTQGKLQIITGANDKAVGQEKTVRAITNILKTLYEAKEYSPEEDIVLVPYNKQACGSINVNNYIAEFLSATRKPVVYHVIAGFRNLYLAEGDKVMFNKRDALIVDISPNHAYSGTQPDLAGTDLTRFGVRRLGEGSTAEVEDFDLEAFDDESEIMDYSAMSVEEIKEQAVNRIFFASHRVTIAYETGNTEVLSAAGDFNDNTFSLGYCMTIHKSQGSEWRKVFVIFHPDQQRNLSREMLYTCITRAREECYIFSKQAVLDKCVVSQRVRGNTLADKIAYFNSGVEQNDLIRVVKK